jgi:hypothetical protein
VFSTGQSVFAAINANPLSPAGNEVYAYDPLDNIRRAQLGPATLDYLFDPNGKNRLDQINLDGQPYHDYNSNDQGDTIKRSRIFSETSSLPVASRAARLQWQP